MPTSPYNPQEILSPLMKRFGRHLAGTREEGYSKMVMAICEEMQVDEPHARQMLETLVNTKLAEYEPVVPATTGDQVLPTTPQEQNAAVPSGDHGAWRLGPPVA